MWKAREGSAVPVHAWLREISYEVSIKRLEDTNKVGFQREQHWIDELGTTLANGGFNVRHGCRVPAAREQKHTLTKEQRIEATLAKWHDAVSQKRADPKARPPAI